MVKPEIRKGRLYTTEARHTATHRSILTEAEIAAGKKPQEYIKFGADFVLAGSRKGGKQGYSYALVGNVGAVEEIYPQPAAPEYIQVVTSD